MMRTTSHLYTENSKSLHLETNLLQLYNNWHSQINSFYSSSESYVTGNVSKPTFTFNFLTEVVLVSTTTDPLPVYSETTSIILPNGLNCTNIDMYFEAKKSYKHIIHFLNIINYIIIIVGIFFNSINLIVLLKSKLNESPYSYLTMLALSDLGALAMVGAEKLRQLFRNSSFVHIYFVMMINIFLSCSMYVTLALTIERFIFVHSPFKAMTICRKSIARKVCCVIFLFSVLRSTYLPLMYSPNCWDGFSQKKDNFLDLYEFLISLAIPYSIIFIANISLILSLKKQNNLMSVPSSTSTYSINLKNSEITIPKKRIRANTILNEMDEYDPISETNTKLSCKSLSLQMEKKIKNEQKNLIHSNTLNSISTTTSNNASLKSSSKKKSKTSSMYHRTSNIREIKNQKKLTITLVIILCLLLFCYLPSFLFEESLADFVFGSHDEPSKDSIRPFIIKAIGNRIAIILIYFNCMANFLIYCFCNKKFKNSLKLLIKKSFINKMYRRFIFMLDFYCCRGKKDFAGINANTEQMNTNINNRACSYYNTYHFKYYQQNNKFKNSLKEMTINENYEVRKSPVVRKSRSLVIK